MRVFEEYTSIAGDRLQSTGVRVYIPGGALKNLKYVIFRNGLYGYTIAILLYCNIYFVSRQTRSEQNVKRHSLHSVMKH